MTFEEQLTQAFETLTERLRGEIDQHVRRALAELAAAAPYDRDPGVLAAARQELELAVSAARQASHAEGLAAGRDAGLAVGKDAGVAAGREEGLAAGREQGFAAGREEGLLAGREAGIAAGREEGFAAGREAGIAAGREEGFAAGREAGIVAGREEGLAVGHDAGRTEGFREAADASALVDASPRRLAEAIRAIDGARSLTEVLDTLVSIASLDASGVDVCLVRSTQLHRWRPKGVTSDEASAVRSLDAGGPLADAARTNTIVRDEGTVAVPMALAGTV